MQPRQTDAVDKFVAREANGYKAEVFSRQRDFILMNRNQESSLPGVTSVPKISLVIRPLTRIFLSGLVPESAAAAAASYPPCTARLPPFHHPRPLPIVITL